MLIAPAVAGLGLAGLDARPAFAIGCGGNSNHQYANEFNTDAGYDTTFRGIHAIIAAYNPPDGVSLPHSNHDSSEQALWMKPPSSGEDFIEIGWYTGWGNETDTYVTDPHAYTTVSGNEIDDLDVWAGGLDSHNLQYQTWWTTGGGTPLANYKVTDETTGTVLVSYAVSEINYHGPGHGIAGGEVDSAVQASGLPMQGTYKNLQMFVNSWADWSSYDSCQDTYYTITTASSTAFSDSGHN